jgi:hypothetical protein
MAGPMKRLISYRLSSFNLTALDSWLTSTIFPQPMMIHIGDTPWYDFYVEYQATQFVCSSVCQLHCISDAWYWVVVVVLDV